LHTGETGHAEVIQVEYDASVVSYEKLLNLFWHAHDPTQVNMQGDDVGTQYRSIILYHNEAQRQAALKSHKELVAPPPLPRPDRDPARPPQRLLPGRALSPGLLHQSPRIMNTARFISSPS